MNESSDNAIALRPSNRDRGPLKALTLVLLCAAISPWPAQRRGQDNQTGRCVTTNAIIDRFDSFQNTSPEFEQAALDSFAIRLLQSQNEIGYIIVYVGLRSCAGEAQMRGVRMKKYLVEHRGVPWDRVIWKDGGFLDKPYVLLEEQLRGNSCPYDYGYPKTLDPKDVQIVQCGHQRTKRAKPRRG